MKVPESWLREWVDPAQDARALGERLTMAGHELEALAVEGVALDGVRVAEVLTVEPHPGADRLRLCTVSSGDGAPLQVVCAAPNVHAGMKGALALPGTRLPNGVELERAAIRGVESDGMLCSAAELRLGDDAGGILELPASAPAGEPLAAWLGLPDAILDLNLTPNRGDCFSVLGIARELAALTGSALAGPAMPAVDAACEAAHPVELLDPRACPRFAARVVRGIDTGARTPLWMTERLRRSGVRAIHPVVDVTNYVMLELGQPLHAYDVHKLDGPVRPRFTRGGEPLTLLDEQIVILDRDTVAITDDSGPIGLAGIMGGAGTAVGAATRDVFLEAAFWPQQVMAGRARRYGLHTDASLRFERGVDPELPPRAIERATELLVAIAGGEPGPTVDHVHPDRLPARGGVTLRRTRLQQVLGETIDEDSVFRILAGLQFALTRTDDGWRATPPSFRFDIVCEEDLIEEVVRVYGYERIEEASAVYATPLVPVAETRVPVERLVDTLVARDYQEVITYSFVDAGTDHLLTGVRSELVLSNPISSEMSVMRGTLWGGLLGVAASNVARQQDRVRIFEVGKSFHGTLDAPREVERLAGLALGDALPEQWGTDAQAVDFFDVKADLEALLQLTGEAGECRFEACETRVLQPGQAARILRAGEAVGVLGKLHPAIAKQLDFKKDALLFELDLDRAFAATVPVAGELSRFPAIRRDIAIVVRDEVSAAEIRAAAASVAPELVREVRVFDVYRGAGIEAGLKSVALGLILQETSRTLTDADADSVMDAAVQKLKSNFAAVLRD